MAPEKFMLWSPGAFVACSLANFSFKIVFSGWIVSFSCDGSSLEHSRQEDIVVTLVTDSLLKTVHLYKPERFILHPEYRAQNIFDKGHDIALIYL